MAKQTKRRRASFGKSVLVALLLVAAALLYPYLSGDNDTPQSPAEPVDGQIQVHVIDVGQGDAILLTTPDGNMLIDAGDNVSKYEQALQTYLDNLGITELEYLVMTHVHADHIGGADMILQNYTVQNVIMTSEVSTSGAFESMMNALEASDANVIEAVTGETFSLGDLHCRILAPLKNYSNTNDMSIVLRATYGDVSMLFTGDAEGNPANPNAGDSEQDILAAYSASELQSDFYKVGHHGSDTSSGAAFLQAVRPKIAAISVGEGNKYGHPLQSVLDALDAVGATCYRTDLSGSLVFVCDGETITYQP